MYLNLYEQNNNLSSVFIKIKSKTAYLTNKPSLTWLYLLFIAISH